MSTAKGVYYIPPAPGIPVSFPCFDRPDREYDYYGGTFHFPPDHEFIVMIDRFVEENFTRAQQNNKKFSRGYRIKEIDGEEMAVVTPKSKDRQPAFDARGKPIPAPAAYGGTICRPKMKIDTKKTKDPGVVIRFCGVQIVKLVERQGGFGDVSGMTDDAYVGSEADYAAGDEELESRKARLTARAGTKTEDHGRGGAAAAAIEDEDDEIEF